MTNNNNTSILSRIFRWLFILALNLASGCCQQQRGASTTTSSNNANDTASLSALKEKVQSTLDGHASLMKTVKERNEENQDSPEDLVAAFSETKHLLESLTVKTSAVDTLLRTQVNVLIARYLQDELTRIYRSERAAREQLEEAAARERGEPQPKKHPYITWTEVESLLTDKELFSDHDESMESWMVDVMKQYLQQTELPDVLEEDPELAAAIQAFEVEQKSVIQKQVEIANAKMNDEQEYSCVSPQEAAQAIQNSLTLHTSFEEREDSFDHAAFGAWVVHEMTSDTFEPPTSARESTPNAWWMGYVPDDWLDAVAWYFDHDQPESKIQELVASTKLFEPNKINSPDAVLHPMVLPGSCWPMAGQSGYITLALPYSIAVRAISVDHVSALLVQNHDDRSSAPRDIQVTGYPPCQGPRCRGLTFDASQPIRIMKLTYVADDSEAPIRQTTPVDFAALANEEGEGGEGECETSSSDSCSAIDPLSNLRPNDMIAALRFDILSNHGNSDYTCVYRIRVHGTSSPDADTEEYDEYGESNDDDEYEMGGYE